jgi:hypothetical protein
MTREQDTSTRGDLVSRVFLMRTYMNLPIVTSAREDNLLNFGSGITEI